MNIITHNGKFHSDEVVAYSIINYLYPENKLVRTRDMDIINNKSNEDIVIDVGMIYDPFNNKFDHHQDNFYKTFNRTTRIPLSSAGLIYKHFGKKLISSLTGSYSDDIYNDFYFNFIIGIDATDNGIDYLNNHHRRNYKTNLPLSQTISMFNNVDTFNDEIQMKSFLEASNFAWIALSTYLKKMSIEKSEIDYDKKAVRLAMLNRYNINKSGEIVVIEDDCFNWSKCIKEYEKEIEEVGKIKFVIYPKKNNTWNVRSMREGFRNRLDIFNSSMEGVNFVHKNRFIANTKDKETAINLSVQSLLLK